MDILKEVTYSCSSQIPFCLLFKDIIKIDIVVVNKKFELHYGRQQARANHDVKD